MGFRDVQGDHKRGDQGAAQSSYVTDREAVWQAFCGLRNDAAPVTLRFDGVETAYSALVVDVDHRRVVLEGIQPASGDLLLRAGRPFSLSARAHGAFIYAPRNVSEPVDTDSPTGTRFLMALPEKLLWQQRRRAPRFSLPAALRGPRARLTLTHGRETVSGMVEDLSASGCRAVFDAAAAPVVAARDQFDDVRVEIGGLLAISARIALRFRETDPATGRVACGIEFTRLGNDERLRLEQFVRSLALRAERQR